MTEGLGPCAEVSGMIGRRIRKVMELRTRVMGFRDPLRSDERS